MKSNLFGENVEANTSERFALQNERMLRIALDGDVMALQGSMVAYQGEVKFDFQGGGVGKFLKKALTGEGVQLMRCTGRGDLFLANNADEVHLLHLENESLSVSGHNILAFDSTLEWDIRRLEGASMLTGGGLFNTVLTGTGSVALASHGTPVVLNTDSPTFVDAQAAIAWSGHLQTRVQKSVKLGALIGRGSGEAFQITFSPGGFVIVQASEGEKIPAHSH